MKKNVYGSILFLLLICFIACSGDNGDGGETDLSSSKTMTTFSFTQAANGSLSTDCAGVISGTTINVTLPHGTSRTALIPTFSATGVSVSVGGIPHVTDVTVADFTQSVIYTVRAEDGTIRDYTVTVAMALEGHIDPVPEFEENFNGPIDNSIWQIASWAEHGGQTSSARCYTSNGMLNMVFRNDSVLGYLSAAIQTRETFLYGRWEARLKPSSVEGVLNSFYTIDWGTGDGTKQEIDIEFLTFAFGEGVGKVHYAVHAEGHTSMNTNPDIDLSFNPSDDFHVYGFEITPEHIEWFVDDEVIHTYTYSENDITIDAPYQLKLNVWSAVHWVNGPPPVDTDCVYQIDWIKFYPYENE